MDTTEDPVPSFLNNPDGNQPPSADPAPSQAAEDPNFSFVAPPDPYSMIPPRGLPRGTTYVPVVMGLGVGVTTRSE